jgi:hypothetical protein
VSEQGAEVWWLDGRGWAIGRLVVWLTCGCGLGKKCPIGWGVELSEAVEELLDVCAAHGMRDSGVVSDVWKETRTADSYKREKW